jgi:hypothetical protein
MTHWFWSSFLPGTSKGFFQLAPRAGRSSNRRPFSASTYGRMSIIGLTPYPRKQSTGSGRQAGFPSSCHPGRRSTAQPRLRYPSNTAASYAWRFRSRIHRTENHDRTSPAPQCHRFFIISLFWRGLCGRYAALCSSPLDTNGYESPKCESA